MEVFQQWKALAAQIQKLLNVVKLNWQGRLSLILANFITPKSSTQLQYVQYLLITNYRIKDENYCSNGDTYPTAESGVLSYYPPSHANLWHLYFLHFIYSYTLIHYRLKCHWFILDIDLLTSPFQPPTVSIPGEFCHPFIWHQSFQQKCCLEQFANGMKMKLLKYRFLLNIPIFCHFGFILYLLYQFPTAAIVCNE